MLRRIRERPWLLVFVAFVVLIAAWIGLIRFAHQHGDQPIPLPPPSARP